MNARQQMVKEQLAGRGISNPLVLQAMSSVPREEFVPEPFRELAYDDGPLPIGEDQTISQPYIVALMTEYAKVQPGHRVLEIGTGSGYQAAILAEIVDQVYTIERIASLAAFAQANLERLGFENVAIRVEDGTLGWPEAAPFDAILVTAGAPSVPPALVDQLASGGRLVLPVGPGISQALTRVTKHADGHLTEELLEPVRFVPLIGQQGWDF